MKLQHLSKSLKLSVLIIGLLLLAVVGFLFIPKSGVEITIISSAGGMPPAISAGTLLKGEDITVVFTDPFTSLDNWEDSRIIKSAHTKTGEIDIDLSAGKYGVFYIYKNKVVLYNNLKSDNISSNIYISRQGPWYIEIPRFKKSRLNISVNQLPS